jgi:hypothetical protein
MKLEDFKFNQDLSDWYESVYKDIWVDNEYERFGINILSGDVVVDCGANIGIFTAFAFDKQAEKVISIELDNDNFNFLEENTSKYKNVTTVLGRVSSQDISLEKILTKFNLKRIDFLKIDIEGHEFDFITNASDDALSRVSKISAELHLWGMFDRITDYVTAGDSSKRCLDLLDKLSRNNFDIRLVKVHQDSCLYMLYAKKI